MMQDLVPSGQQIATMSDDAIARVRQLEEVLFQFEQTPVLIDHVLHGGMYARTAFIPAGVTVTGVLVKVPTVLILQGVVSVYIGTNEPMEISGYAVLPAGAGRKQAFVAHTDTCLTMMMPSDAKTIEEAEHQFTDEFDLLASHKDAKVNTIRIT